MTTLLADLGGTRLKAGLAPQDVVAVEHGGDWAGAVRAAVQRTGADEVALAVPGIVDRGRVVALPGKLPGLEGADLEQVLGVRVGVLLNDALAYGIGEATAGAGAGHDRVVVVTLGTGVGVAVLQDGAPLGRGPFGGGLLGGQLPLGAGTATFESACRAAALERDGLQDYRASLVRGLTALCLAHAPDCVVVGGGGARSDLLDGVQEAVTAGLWPGQSVQVRLGRLGDAAALVGLQTRTRTQVTA